MSTSDVKGEDGRPPGLAESELDRSATLQLLISMARAFKFVDDRVRPKIAAQGLAMTEFAVLEVLYHKGPIPLGELSERILVTGASTTYTVKKLEKRGLILRRKVDEDQRVVMAELTHAGLRLIGRVIPLHIEDLQRVMTGLSTTEKRTAARLLRKLRKPAMMAK